MNARWSRILEFNFDNPMSEYGFSTRLARENYWTKKFTQKAILEYKKFMYLASVSEMMVSPSEVIDVVWHQHLIFTQSYSDFCNLIEKQIQHIPSTHNHADAEKFQQAKERTKKLYTATFGEQPTDIWQSSGMYESLRLDKSNIKIRTFILLGILTFALLALPFSYFLLPIYMHINNPDFLIGYIALAGITMLILERTNRFFLLRTIRDVGRASFLFELDPMEVMYLKTQQVSNVVHATVNQLIVNKKLYLLKDSRIEKAEAIEPTNLEEYIVLETLALQGNIQYPSLLRVLVEKFVFQNTANCMDALKKYFIKSKKFGTLFYINFTVFSVVAMLGFVRLLSGIARDKPVGYLSIILMILLVAIIFYLYRLTRLFCTSTVPSFYRKELLPERSVSDSWEWQYFLLGQAVLSSAFVPFVDKIETQYDWSSTSSDGGSCGSSCGSSCSSCGGCGGD